MTWKRGSVRSTGSILAPKYWLQGLHTIPEREYLLLVADALWQDVALVKLYIRRPFPAPDAAVGRWQWARGTRHTLCRYWGIAGQIQNQTSYR